MDTASEEALNPAIKRAHDAGILVITFDNVSTSPYAIRINEDQRAFGSTMADWLVKQLNGKGNVFMITGVPGDHGRRWPQRRRALRLRQEPGHQGPGRAAGHVG